MAYLNWSTSLELGVHAMDDEHRVLVALMNDFVAIADAGGSPAQVKQALSALHKSVVDHFASEERYQESIGFPGLEGHKRIHANLLASLAKHAADIQRTGSVSDDFKAFLRMWLKSHIMGLDTKYAAHAGARKAS